VLSGIGLAVVGGITAVMLLSPRTRRRALVAAKDTYGKVNQRMSHLTHAKQTELRMPMTNDGFDEQADYGTSGL
jgi:hypothetical protein